jgi:hypothetical protein
MVADCVFVTLLADMSLVVVAVNLAVA